MKNFLAKIQVGYQWILKTVDFETKMHFSEVAILKLAISDVKTLVGKDEPKVGRLRHHFG